MLKRDKWGHGAPNTEGCCCWSVTCRACDTKEYTLGIQIFLRRDQGGNHSWWGRIWAGNKHKLSDSLDCALLLSLRFSCSVHRGRFSLKNNIPYRKTAVQSWCCTQPAAGKLWAEVNTSPGTPVLMGIAAPRLSWETALPLEWKAAWVSMSSTLPRAQPHLRSRSRQQVLFTHQPDSYGEEKGSRGSFPSVYNTSKLERWNNS